MKKFFEEFKKFISRGNVFDMAVGLIIATAFNKIVSSMVNDIIMPLVTFATGAASLNDLSIPLKWTMEAGEKVVTLRWAYGAFIQTIIDFFIIALSVFIMVKVVNKSRESIEQLSSLAKKQVKKEFIEERKQVKLLAKAQNIPFKLAWEQHLKEKQEKEKQIKLEQEEKKKLEEIENAKQNPSTETLLKEIRDLLKEKNN